MIEVTRSLWNISSFFLVENVKVGWGGSQINLDIDSVIYQVRENSKNFPVKTEISVAS